MQLELSGAGLQLNDDVLALHQITKSSPKPHIQSQPNHLKQ